MTSLLLIVFLICSPICSTKAKAGEAWQYKRHLTKVTPFLDQEKYPKAAINYKPEEAPVILLIPIPDMT